MITEKEYDEAVKQALKYYEKAGIVISEEEKKRVEVADFGLKDLKNIGLQIITYINTDRVCSKEMVLFPYQACPEHRHPDGIDGSGTPFKGKEETFRCRYGKVYLYVEGKPAKKGEIKLPPTDTTVYHQIILTPGMQYTLYPDTLHWFAAGEEGAVISEFSTKSRDEYDIFTDKRIVRAPKISK